MTSAFGKTILLGEHAVVHGRSALAAAVNRSVVCRFEGRSTGAIALKVPHWNLDLTVGDAHPLAEAMEVIARGVGADHLSVDLHAVAELPPAAGLGSSAAMMVAITQTLAAAAGVRLSREDVVRIASDGERLFHDNPSGIDVALAAHGGIGLFKKGTGLVSINAPAFELVVGLTGEPRRTADMVARVAESLEADADGTNRIFDEMGTAAEQMAQDLEGGDMSRLGERMNRAQEILTSLNLSTRAINTLCDTAARVGAQGAKLTGAGGGGAVIAYAPDNADDLVAAFRSLGREAFVIEAGCVSHGS